MATELLAGLCVLSALACAWAGLELAYQLTGVEWRLVRQSAYLSEAKRLRDAQQRIEAMQIVTETGVEVGARTTQAIHRGIANIPFSILESIPATRTSAKVVRGTHDLISDSVYETISVTNKFAHRLIFGRKKKD